MRNQRIFRRNWDFWEIFFILLCKSCGKLQISVFYEAIGARDVIAKEAFTDVIGQILIDEEAEG